MSTSKTTGKKTTRRSSKSTTRSDKATKSSKSTTSASTNKKPSSRKRQSTSKTSPSTKKSSSSTRGTKKDKAKADEIHALQDLLKRANEAFAKDDYQLSWECGQSILEKRPQHPATLNLMGIVAHKLGKTDESQKMLAMSCDLDPENAIFHNNHGTILKDQGKVLDSIKCFRTAIGCDPHFTDAYLNLANTYIEENNTPGATDVLEEAVSATPDNEKIRYQLANLLAKTNRPNDAITHYTEILKSAPDYASVFVNLGVALHNMGQTDQAVDCYKRALALNPEQADSLSNLGVAYKRKNQFDKAIECFRRALKLNDQVYGVYCNLGNALQGANRLDEADKCYQRALELNPKFAEAYNSRGFTLQCQNRLDEAFDCYTKAMALKKDYVDAHWNHALALLVTGQFEQGWAEYEWRWQKSEMSKIKRPDHEIRWDGSALAGRTLLVHTEQGYGDTIQFVRFLDKIDKGDGKILLECRKPLVPLLQQLDNVDQVIKRDSQPLEFDVYVPLLSLPLLFHITADTIPHEVPYLHGTTDRQQKFNDVIQPQSESLNIGIVWGGSQTHKNDINRSVSLERFMPLVNLPNTTFYSLQKGAQATELTALGAQSIITDLDPFINDFADTAAAISLLDFIICIDTSVAHLAGALNKPVWNLMPFAPDWRWQLNRNDSPWYPSMRLYRQPQLSNWDGVFSQVYDDLSVIVSSLETIRQLKSA